MPTELPHTLEPKYPGISEHLVDLSGCWDSEKLKNNTAELIELYDKNHLCHERSYRFLMAASSLIGDTYKLSLESALIEKAKSFSIKLAAKEIKPTLNFNPVEKIRFLSAVTPKGIFTFESTAQKLAQKLYIIDDKYGAVSRTILETIRKYALNCGYDIISCYCPIAPHEKLEHLFVPALGLGFVTSNQFHKFEIPCHKKINSERFYDIEKLKSKKQRIGFNKKASSELVDEAISLLKEAKSIHDQIEKYYINAMDFTSVDKIAEQTIEKIKSIKK